MEKPIRHQLIATLLIALFMAANGSAQLFAPKPKAVTEPVAAGKEALKTAAPPWYDADSDAIKSLELEAEAKEDRARSDWKPEKKNWTIDWSWWPDFSFLGEFVRYLGWLVLIAILALIIYALVKAFMNVDPGINYGASSPTEQYDSRADQERIENLPVPVTARKGNFLDIARQCYEAGEFGDAIIYLFSHRLLQLDRAGQLRLTKGKTNRQYLREIATSRDLQQILGPTIVGFEDVFFGKHTLTRERFEDCWRQNQRFEQLLQQVIS